METIFDHFYLVFYYLLSSLDIINYGIELNSLIKSFSDLRRKEELKFKYLEKKKSF